MSNKLVELRNNGEGWFGSEAVSSLSERKTVGKYVTNVAPPTAAPVAPAWTDQTIGNAYATAFGPFVGPGSSSANNIAVVRPSRLQVILRFREWTNTVNTGVVRLNGPTFTSAPIGPPPPGSSTQVILVDAEDLHDLDIQYQGTGGAWTATGYLEIDVVAFKQ